MAERKLSNSCTESLLFYSFDHLRYNPFSFKIYFTFHLINQTNSLQKVISSVFMGQQADMIRTNSSKPWNNSGPNCTGGETHKFEESWNRWKNSLQERYWNWPGKAHLQNEMNEWRKKEEWHGMRKIEKESTVKPVIYGHCFGRPPVLWGHFMKSIFYAIP